MTEPTDKSSCRHCHAEVGAGARFCPQCGYTTASASFPVQPIAAAIILLGCVLLITAPREAS